MRSKRLLTLVVALCMLVSLMAPAANAVQINNAKPETNENATITTNKFNDLLATFFAYNNRNTYTDVILAILTLKSYAAREYFLLIKND